MTFNLLVGGVGRGQPLERIADVIRAARADVAGLQETRTWEGDRAGTNNGAKIAALLGWHWFDQGEGTGVVSKHDVLGATPARHGVKIALPGGHGWIFNVHLPHAPYQPYQLLSIPYADAPFVTTVAAAVRSANEARGAAIAACLEAAAGPMVEGVPVFLTGDFNEPSHLDWTAAAAAARRCPVAVSWPATKAAALAGFTDGWRAMFPDPVAAPGYTWTPLTEPGDPADHHDRIDFVMAHGVTGVAGAWIVGERKEAANVVVDPFPSDHRAVVVEFFFSPRGPVGGAITSR